jgi:hypothetical protein
MFFISCGNKHDYKYKLTNTKTGVKYYCDSLTTKNDTLGFQNTNQTFIPITRMEQLQIIQGLNDTENY